MLRFFNNASYDFIGVRRWAYGLTAAGLVPGLLLLLLLGLNYSIEFTGGTLIRVRPAATPDLGAVRAGLAAEGIAGAEIQSIGTENEFVVRARTAAEGTDADDTQATIEAVRRALTTSLGADGFELARTGAVSPKVGSELRIKALLAILLSFVAVLAYLAVRFEWRFGLAAVIATGHDILATIAFIAVLRIEVSLTVVAAILSMVGYSLNDTIIIFDRVRENLRKHQRMPFKDVLNLSINETLPRSVLTHGTTIATLSALAIFGGDVIRPFALVMLFGVFLGTFSSIYIASPVLMAIEAKWPGPHARGVRTGAPREAARARRTQPVA